jgi:hypothetical protein
VTLVGGCTLIVLLGIGERFTGYSVPLSAYAGILVLLGLVACYQAWKDERRKTVKLTEVLAEKNLQAAANARREAIIRGLTELYMFGQGLCVLTMGKTPIEQDMIMGWIEDTCRYLSKTLGSFYVADFGGVHSLMPKSETTIAEEQYATVNAQTGKLREYIREMQTADLARFYPKSLKASSTK